jgi:conjugal transfer pilus assembly protein TraW
MRSLFRFIFLLISCQAFSAFGADMGVVGPTYEITEPDLIEVIQARLKRMEVTGELARKQTEYRNKVVSGIEAPKAVPGVRATEQPRTYHIDPTVTVDRDIRNADGAMLYARGVKVNPLDHVSLTRNLLFFDARDSRQINFAKRRLNELSGKSKPILVAGEPLKLMRAWKQTVYYDQGGSLVRRLGIRQVPAIVSQDGKRLRIDEVRP